MIKDSTKTETLSTKYLCKEDYLTKKDAEIYLPKRSKEEIIDLP